MPKAESSEFCNTNPILMEKQMNLKRALIVLLMAAFIVPNIAMAQITARFEVNKFFTDGFDGEVLVTIVCNTGLPLQQFALVSPGLPVTFVVEELDIDVIGEPTICTITEDGEDGYIAVYDATGADESVISCEFDSGGIFENLNPINECDIVNTPAPVTVAITKEWVTTNTVGEGVDEEIYIFARSEGFITGGHECYEDGPMGEGIDGWCIYVHFDGSETRTIQVVPSYLGTNVYLYEEIFDSSVESSNNCGNGFDGMEGMVTVYPDMGAACKFTNTVFFEGIPTLSQYGLAIMALLMLGVGFVGFRRFV